MADSDDEDLRPSHASDDLPVSMGGGSSNQNVHVIDEDVSILGQPPHIGHPARPREETLQEQINIQPAEAGGQVGEGEARETGYGSRDKGKAPARAYDNFSSSSQVNNTETSHASLSPQSHTAISGIAEDLKELKFPSTSTADLADEKAPDEPKESGVGSADKNCSTPPQEPALTSKQKQKQKAAPEKDAEPEPAPPAPTLGGPNPGEATEPPAFRPLRPGDPGWEKSSDRPPKKLPIRLKDAVGRQFVFPWEKVKTWQGMERLIRSCFMHVDVIGPYVMDRRYDLLTYLPFEDPDMEPQTVAAQPVHNPAPVPEAASSTVTPTTSTASVSLDGGAPDPPAASTSSAPAVPHAPPPPPAVPSPPPPPPAPPVQQARVIILPELWEDTVEPGMSIWMQMWPIVPRDWPLDVQPPAAAPPPGPPGPPHLFPGGFVGARGRGRGRGGGMGRGGGVPMHHPHGHHMPPPRVIMVEHTKTRGKTRKKQEGP
ncbi:hypothetical protein Hte_009953 [Hypoxylon texense]